MSTVTGHNFIGGRRSAAGTITLESEPGKGSEFIVNLCFPLSGQKAEIKQTEKKIAKLEAKKAAAEAKAAEAAKKVEAEAVLKKLLASGMTADEILEKLK